MLTPAKTPSRKGTSTGSRARGFFLRALQREGEQGWHIGGNPLRLYTPGGHNYSLVELGRGAFVTAFEIADLGIVIAEAHDIGGQQLDLSKLMLAEMFQAGITSPHLPKIVLLGQTSSAQLFAMPKYKVPLRKEDAPQAWKWARTLRECGDRAQSDIEHKWVKRGFEARARTVECARRKKLPASLVHALDELSTWANLIGPSTLFEFPNRNLGVDDEGNLVLLDVVFDVVALAKAHKAKTPRRNAGSLPADVAWFDGCVARANGAPVLPDWLEDLREHLTEQAWARIVKARDDWGFSDPVDLRHHALSALVDELDSGLLPPDSVVEPTESSLVIFTPEGSFEISIGDMALRRRGPVKAASVLLIRPVKKALAPPVFETPKKRRRRTNGSPQTRPTREELEFLIDAGVYTGEPLKVVTEEDGEPYYEIPYVVNFDERRTMTAFWTGHRRHYLQEKRGQAPRTRSNPSPPRPARAGLGSQLNALRPKLAKAAQGVVDDWVQDDEGLDDELGAGGICDRVASALADVIVSNLHDVEVEDGGHDGDDHAWLIVSKGAVRFGVDIPASVYETGGGYNWRKRPDAQVTVDDVLVWNLDS